MNVTEYQQKLGLLRLSYQESVKKLKEKFLLSNNKIEVEAKIKDHLGSGIVKKVCIDFDKFDEAQISYYCEITFANWKRKSLGNRKYRKFEKSNLI